MVIYADVLVALNILFTYIFLVCVRVFTHIPTNKYGVAMASFLGGLSSIIVFFDNLGILIPSVYKVLTCSIIVLISFLPKNIKSFIKLFFSFLGVSIIFGGAMYFLEIWGGNHKILYFNGTVYYDMDIKYLIACTFLIYGCFSLCSYLLEKKANKNEVYRVKIFFRDVCVSLSGFVDTGNSLADVLTGKTVLIGELSALSPFFTYEELVFFKKGVFENIPDGLGGIIRLVPAFTVSENSLLPVFTPSKVTIFVNGKECEIKNVCIAVVNKKLLAGEYNLLLNKNIFEQVM